MFKNFKFNNNPFNITKREYWTPQAIIQRLVLSIIVNMVTTYATRKYIDHRDTKY